MRVKTVLWVAAALVWAMAGAEAQGFVSTGSLTTARIGPVAVRLQDERVLVAGGVGQDGQALQSAEIYDPSRGGFTATGNLGAARAQLGSRPEFAAELLPSGRVLVMGGDPDQTAATTEIYDPAAGTFSPGPSLPQPLVEMEAVSLPDGRVVMTGPAAGCSGFPCSAPFEIYDEQAGTITLAGEMHYARSGFTATALADGSVLIDSGFSINSGATSPTATAELYDPGTGTSTLLAAVAPMSYRGSAARLADNNVLLCGGANHEEQASPQCEIYGNQQQDFTATVGPLEVGRDLATMTVLDDGRVLVAGGNLGGPPDAEVYDPALETFGGGVNFGSGRMLPFAAALLKDGEVLFAGGEQADGSAEAAAALYQAAAPAADFSLSAAETQVVVSSGDQAQWMVLASGSNGFDGTIQLSCSSPAGTTCALGTAAISAGDSSTVTLSGFKLAAGGVVQTTVTGTSGGLAHSITLQANLEPPVPSFSPASLSFGDETVGQTSASQTIMLANSGASDLTIAGIAASGDFAETNDCPASLANVGGPTCTITVTFTPTQTGARTGQIMISDNAPFSPQSVALSGNGVEPQVSLTPAAGSPAEEAVDPGQSAEFKLTMAGQDGFAGPVSLTCAGAPAESTCAVSPASTTLAGGSVAIAVAVTTTAGGVAGAGRAAPGGGNGRWPLAAAGLLLALALAVAAARRRRLRVGLTGAAVMFGLAAALAGCGGARSASSGNSAQIGTPAGTYQLTVAAESGDVQAGSAELTLVVK